MGKKVIFNEEQLTELKQMLDNHVRQLDIARHFNVTDDTIRKICRDNDLEIKMPHKCVCILCGDTFYSNVKGAKTCKQEHHRICTVCGKDFIVDREDIRDTCKGECSSIKKYGVSHPRKSKEVKEKCRQTSIERYGVPVPSMRPEHIQKCQQTCLARYGSTSWTGSEIGKEQLKKTNLEKYGVEWNISSEAVRNKSKKTNIERYGTENPMQNEFVVAKAKSTNLKRYGVENVMQNPEIRKKFSDNMFKNTGYHWNSQNPDIKAKIQQTCQERFGVPWACMRPEARNYNARSKINASFEEILNELNIEYSTEFPLDHYSYDFRLSNNFIEINPSITHNSHMSMFKGVDPKPFDYHLKKTQVAEEAGYRCIHVFDWDNWETVIQLVLPKKHVYARQCKVMKIDKNTAEIFTSKNHIQGSCRGQNIVYGLYYQGELVEVMTFGKPRYNSKFDLELLRLCTKSDLNVIGGASKLFSQFKKDYPNASVISYCDYAKFTGRVYEQMGMKLDKITKPAKVWSKENKYITDNLLRQRGYDQIFHTNYGKGTSNEKLMLENGWLPVYDCGQKVFTYFPST